MAAIVGRDRELSAGEAFIDRAGGGVAGLALDGEAGIGKTTIWLETANRARERNFAVLASRPAEAEARLSFTAIGDLLTDVPSATFDLLPGPQRHALDVIRYHADPADQPVDQRAVGVALGTVITALSMERPVLLAIDDVQWLDAASATALRFVLRRLLAPRVGVLLAARTGERPRLAIEELGPQATVTQVTVEPLSFAALHHVLRERIGMPIPRRTLRRIENASGGNPFFAIEIARALEARSGATSIDDPLPVPDRLQALVSSRLRRLSPPAREAVLIAAALARPTRATVLAALDERLDPEEALLEAERAGVLDASADPIRFAHPLLASTVYAMATAPRRRELHRRLAEIAADPEERARHLARSDSHPDERVASEIESGAALAERRGATEAAAELYEAAYGRTLVDQVDAASRRMLGAGRARLAAGDVDAAKSLAGRALETARLPDERARALLLLGTVASYTDTTERRVELQKAALAEAGDPALRAEVLLGLEQEIVVDPAQLAARTGELIPALRERADDPWLLAQMLFDHFFASAVLGRGAPTELLAEGLALEAESPRQPNGMPLLWYQHVDDLERARARHRLADDWTRDRGLDLTRALVTEFIAMAEFHAGNWAEAEALLEGACAVLEQLEPRGRMTPSFADRSLIDAHRGRIARARATIVRMLERIDPRDYFWRIHCHSASGVIEFFDGDYEAADAAWTRMHEEAEKIGWQDFVDDRSEPDHIEALLALGERERAERVLDRLEWRARTIPRRWIDATLPRSRALLLAADGDVAAALEALPDGGDPGLPFDRARNLLVLGILERRARQRGKAKRSFEEALRLFEQLGAPMWAERVRTELGRLGLRHTTRDELTQSEQEIAALAARGLTNRRVAETLSVSPKTVEATLARVYAKLGITSRAELGARMGERPQT